jgi:hypothetical protein
VVLIDVPRCDIAFVCDTCSSSSDMHQGCDMLKMWNEGGGDIHLGEYDGTGCNKEAQTKMRGEY